MGAVFEIIVIVLVVLYVMTFITEPMLSIEYTKAVGKSLFELIEWIVETLGSFKDDEENKTNTTIT